MCALIKQIVACPATWFALGIVAGIATVIMLACVSVSKDRRKDCNIVDMANVLKHCPFCGDDGKIHLEEDYWFVSCDNCQSGTTAFKREEDAVDMWNERVTDGASQN